MSALGDLAAALLPPEAGGPEPERVAAASRRLLERMPTAARVGVGAGLVGVESASLLRLRRSLGAAPPEQRAELLREIVARRSGAAILDGLKSIVLMAAGGEGYAAETAEVGTRHEPARPDAELRLTPGAEWPQLTTCDSVVIGSGAGGAFAARALARAGHDVIVVEEGERWTVEQIRTTHPLDRFAGLYRDAGTTFALGSPPIALPLGRAVGGTTVVNSGTCYRPPDAVASRWAEGHGLQLAEADVLSDRLADVEATIGVAPVPAGVMGRNGELAIAGANALGWRAGPLQRNAPGCRGACQCSIGCPNNAKGGVHLNALPQACESGARLVSGLRAERVLDDGGRAGGVEVRRPDGSRAQIRARVVVVACGATETPALLRRSGMGRHPRMGRGLSIHPALGTAGRFAEPVHAWRGVLQSVGVEELHERKGILLEATSTPPGMGAMAVPGIGSGLVDRLAGAHHLASVGAMIADAPSGRVLGSRRPTVLYRLTARDGRRLVEALGATVRVLLAAGAEQVELGAGAPAVRSATELAEALPKVDVRRLRMAAFHPTGSAGAGGDPGHHPVGPTGELRGTRGVWIADGSIVPTCPGVNPQVSIMALAAGVGKAAAAA